MPRMMLDVNTEDLKALVLQLPAEELLSLADAIEDRVETLTMMQLAQSGFAEWNEAGEDLYDGEG